jgi:hypothetical protein
MTFKPAVRTQRKLRGAIYGASGSGKTYSALLIAQSLGSNIALIDTERSSASLYADRFKFHTCELDSHTPDDFKREMDEGAAAKFDVLIIDSLSHAWMGEGGILDMADARGRKFDVWKSLTPVQRKLIDHILVWPGHVIVTMRSKTHYDVSKDDKGNLTVERVGLAPVQRAEVEYEFDFVGHMDQENTLHIFKSRFEPIKGSHRQPGEKFALLLKRELESGATPPPPKASVPIEQRIADGLAHIKGVQSKSELEKLGKALSTAPDEIQKALLEAYEQRMHELQPDQAVAQ